MSPAVHRRREIPVADTTCTRSTPGAATLSSVSVRFNFGANASWDPTSAAFVAASSAAAFSVSSSALHAATFALSHVCVQSGLRECGILLRVQLCLFRRCRLRHHRVRRRRSGRHHRQSRHLFYSFLRDCWPRIPLCTEIAAHSVSPPCCFRFRAERRSFSCTPWGPLRW